MEVGGVDAAKLSGIRVRQIIGLAGMLSLGGCFGADAATPEARAPAPEAQELQRVASLGPPSLAIANDFGSVALGATSAPIAFSLTNVGGDSTGPMSATVSDPQDFVTDGSCLGMVLASGASCQVTVRFAPSGAAGAKGAALTVAATPGGQATASLVGTALLAGGLSMSPAGYDFGGVALGQTSAQTLFTVQNTMPSPSGTLSVTLSDTTDFILTTNNCPAVLAGGASCTLGVRFAPASVGSKPGVTLGVAASPGGSPSASLNGVGSATLTVQNAGGGTVTSTPAGIDCGATCSATFTSTPVVLTATPDPTHAFAGWSGACSGSGACSAPVDRANVAVTATFLELAADLSLLSLVGTPDPVLLGSDVTYTIRVHNAGPDAAPATMVTDTLAASATFASAAASQGSCSSAGPIVTCNLGTLPSDGDATVSIAATTTASGTIANGAVVTSGIADPTTGNNSAAVSTTVCGPGDPNPECLPSCPIGTVSGECSCGGSALTAGFCCSGACCSGVQAIASCSLPACAGGCQTPVPSSVPANQGLVIEGTTVTDTQPGVAIIVAIPRSAPISFAYRNNSVTAENSGGYLLAAGGESPSFRDHFLDGSIVTGNRFTWTGTDQTAITHALFVGYGINHRIEYNFLKDTPYGVVTKSSGMTFTSGGVAYNIITNPVQGGTIKGINGVKFYNNTFYQSRSTGVSASLRIYANQDAGAPGFPSTNAQVFNNVFYTKFQVPNISLGTSSRPGFQSDFNVFFCESGTPMFVVEGLGNITFAQWQALGYDTHSVVVDPHFVDTDRLIPSAPLGYGKDLGSEWQAGLSPQTVWGSEPVTTNQGPTWQCGAYIVE
jgi:uncharacterized repeat protein (TIGR01451 family)